MKLILTFLSFIMFAIPYPSLAAPIATSSMVLGDQKTIALTFDDGPYGTSTEQVLSILKTENVHATFFLTGQNVKEFPQEAVEIVAAGNKIGNHTYTHTDLSKLSTEQSLADIQQAEIEIASTTGVHTMLFRPPYGILPTTLKKALKKKGFKIKMWNDDPRDWDSASSTSALIVSRVLNQEKLHTVLILHDGRDTHVNYPRDNMTDALPKIIENFESQGYTFVTL
jgi:peptidoglycan/xylan/chitin deacetylase (PgdA/CDA1 family)